MVQISDENLTQLRSGKVTKISPPSSLFSKDERLTDIGHSMIIGNLILGANIVTASYLIHYDSLLQNATVLLQNATALVQIATILLQNVTLITKCNVIANCDSEILVNIMST